MIVPSADSAAAIAKVAPFVMRLTDDALEFEGMTALMCDKSLLSSFAELVTQAGASAKDARPLVTAFMLCRHPDVMSLSSERVREQAQRMVLALSDLILAKCTTEEFARVMQRYVAVFEGWRLADKRQLDANLDTEIGQIAKLLADVNRDGAEKSHWVPHVAAYQETVLKCKAALQQYSAEMPSNLQMAHDLFLEGTAFDYFALYNPGHTAQLEEHIARLQDLTPEGVYQIVDAMKTTLKDKLLRDGPTLALIDESIDLVLIREQLSKGAFDFRSALRHILELASTLCSEARDSQVAGLLQALPDMPVAELAGGTLRLLSDLNKDNILFSLSIAFPNLPSIIVQYERDEFAKLHKRIPVTERVVKRICAPLGGFKTAYDLAAEMLLFALANEGALPELFALDKWRIKAMKQELASLAATASCRLTSKASVPELDPTLKLVQRRLSDSLRAVLYSEAEPDLSLTLGPLTSQLGVLKRRMRAMLEHNHKVFQPVYYKLAQL